MFFALLPLFSLVITCQPLTASLFLGQSRLLAHSLELPYPTTSPVALLPGSHLPVPMPDPAYIIIPCASSASLLPGCLRLHPGCLLHHCSADMTFFVGVHDPWSFYSKISKHCTLYVAIFPLTIAIIQV